MPKKVGRILVIKKGGSVLSAVRAKELPWAGEGIDITSDDDSGQRTYLDTLGTESIDLSVEGVWNDDVLADIAFSPGIGKMLTDITIEHTDTGRVIAGDFLFTAYSESGPTADALTYSATLQSSGARIYTPAP